MGTYSKVKRCADLLLAGFLLVLLSPVCALVALAILIEDGRPIIFNQERVGRDGMNFRILKFRSMEIGAPNVASANAAEIRITRIGRFTRRFSLDEIPQVLNVIRGEMSFVGPRPALPSQSELLTVRQSNGASGLRPGITGLAQVDGFEGMSEKEKGRLDGRYAEHLSLQLDLNLIVRTFAFLAKEPPRV